MTCNPSCLLQERRSQRPEVLRASRPLLVKGLQGSRRYAQEATAHHQMRPQGQDSAAHQDGIPIARAVVTDNELLGHFGCWRASVDPKRQQATKRSEIMRVSSCVSKGFLQ
eukprot:12129357-Alexandrium_andersonii.AAC.1